MHPNQQQPSLAGINFNQDYGFNKPFEMPKLDIKSLLEGQDFGLSPDTTSLAGLNKDLIPSGETGFFDPSNSMMDNAGQALGLAGGVASLADMFNNWGMQKKAMNLNMDSVSQAMGNRQTAFDDRVTSLANSRTAISNANTAANQQQGTGG